MKHRKGLFASIALITYGIIAFLLGPEIAFLGIETHTSGWLWTTTTVEFTPIFWVGLILYWSGLATIIIGIAATIITLIRELTKKP